MIILNKNFDDLLFERIPSPVKERMHGMLYKKQTIATIKFVRKV